MKKLLILLTAGIAATSSVLAGPSTPQSKLVTPVEELYGVGWYGAIDGGVNIYQSFSGGESASVRGHKLSLDPSGEVGGFGGLKLGYVFGTGFVRPALEADCFYNGFESNLDLKVDGKHLAGLDSRLDSGAFLGNVLIRFNLDRFQPYVGAGAGCWVGKANDASVKIGSRSYSVNGSDTETGFAWQVVAGADYYFTPKFSSFLEYKFLNYEDCVFDGAIRQQLVALGLRLHF